MEIDKKYIINLQGKEFITFEGLLVLFHANKGKEIITEEVEKSSFDSPMFKATVSGERGTFTGHGDANNTNVNSMIAKHKYRMAETRAIARALRWYNNIGLCSVDELGGSENVDIETKIEPRANYNDVVTGDNNKPWITDALFKDAIKKCVEAGTVKIGTDKKEVAKILRLKYKVAKKYEDMIDREIESLILPQEGQSTHPQYHPADDIRVENIPFS